MSVAERFAFDDGIQRCARTLGECAQPFEGTVCDAELAVARAARAGGAMRAVGNG